MCGCVCLCVCECVCVCRRLCVSLYLCADVCVLILVLGGIIFLPPVYGITNSEQYSVFHDICR